MRTIPAAMIWELWMQGRVLLLLAALGSNILPIALYRALSSHGPIDWEDPSLITTHIFLTQINMFCFGSAVLAVQGEPTRLYTAPVTTSTIVAWNLIPSMFLLFAQTVLSTLLMNGLFGLDWPVWGPALFAAVAWAAVRATLFQTEKSGWLVLALSAVAAIVGLWYTSRHGPLFSQPAHMWRELTVVDVLTMLAITALSSLAAVNGVERNRRGDTLPSLGIVAWFERLLDPPPAEGPPFRSRLEAQEWMEWRVKGWAMPFCVILGMFIGLTIWLITSRDQKLLMDGLIAGGGLLSVVGLIGGLMHGNCGPDDYHYEMGSFLASRPMTTRELARVVLKSIAKSVTLSWSLWALLFSVAFLILNLLNIPFRISEDLHIRWWYFWLTILGPWVIAGMCASLILIGDRWFFMEILIGLFVSWIVWVASVQTFLAYEQQILANQILCCIVGIVFTVGTAAAFRIGLRELLVSRQLTYIAGAAWLAGSLALLAMYWLRPVSPISNVVLAVGVLAMAACPLATVPLAISRNRVR